MNEDSTQPLPLFILHPFGVYPREPGTEARLPVRQKLHCEAPAGVADPVTTLVQRDGCLYPGGRVVLVSRNPSTQQSSAVARWSGAGLPRPRCVVSRPR